MIVLFHKPYGVLSQFTSDGSLHKTLSEFGFPKQIYPVGRLDADSEGMLLLSDEDGINDRLLNPNFRHKRTYWALVERKPSIEAIQQLCDGVVLERRQTLPCRACILSPQPSVEPREPPVRLRKNVEDFWISLILHEGRNRQVRKMTAAVGHPTLRLLRVAIGSLTLEGLPRGVWRTLSKEEGAKLFTLPDGKDAPI